MPGTSFLNHFPVDPNDPVLNDLQGNILKGHGRQFTFNLFLSFKPGKKNPVRNWIASFSKVFVTSAKKQLDETRRFHDERIPGSIFCALFLTAEGYAYLGVPTANTPTDPRFAKGMKASGPALHDPAPGTWSKGLNGDAGTIHAMILVADADIHQARSLARAIRLSLADKADIVATERGVVLRNAKGEGIEHNNYVDGVSQPIFFDDERKRDGQLLPIDQWDPSATPALMLVPDPGGKLGDASMGSYFVFRKLEQNVRGFKTREKQVASSVFGFDPDPSKWTPAQAEKAELIGAWAVGRFEDGTPVVLHDEGQNPPLGHQENNFNYADPGSEGKCPFHAHIRKSGPRTDAAGVGFNKGKRLVRRGIPFQDKARIREADGSLSDKPEEQPTNGVGLLFMCYVADIANQFEFVQEQWVNAPSFSHPGTGKDPLIGQPADNTVYHWPPAYGDTTHPRKDVRFGDFITMRGGAYFFAPCLSMLQSLNVPASTKVGGLVSVAANVQTQPVVKAGDPATKPIDPTVFHPDLTLINFDPDVAALDQTLQLFVPDKSDIGAGVVNVPAAGGAAT